MSLRCHMCGMNLGDTEIDWMNNLYIKTLKISRRKLHYFHGLSKTYRAGHDDDDGSVNFGVHSACLQILSKALQAIGLMGIPTTLCMLLQDIHFHVMFQTDRAATYIDRDSRSVSCHSIPCDEDEDSVFAHPLPVFWEDLEDCHLPERDEEKAVIAILQRSKTDQLLKLPCEVMSLVLQYLPPADLHCLRAISLAARLATLSNHFWRNRYEADIPYADLISGRGASTFEVKYKILTRNLNHGTGRAAFSLQNLHRIYYHAHRLCSVISSRVPLGPKRGFIPVSLLAAPIHISFLRVGRSAFIAGLWSSLDESFGYGYRYYGEPTKSFNHYKSRCSPCSGQVVLYGAESGIVGLGFKQSSSDEVYIGLQNSGTDCIYHGVGSYQERDGLYLEFDSLKLRGVKFGPENELVSPLLWTPHLLPSSCLAIDVSSRIQLHESEPRHLCYFGNPKDNLLEKLVQINAFFTRQDEAITGLEFEYYQKPSIKWGPCVGSRLCRVIDGPGGERIVSVEVSATDRGIESIILYTNSQRRLVLNSTSTPNSSLVTDKSTNVIVITGFFGLFRNTSVSSTGSPSLKTIGILSESSDLPAVISKQDRTGDGTVPLHALRKVSQPVWKTCVASASAEEVSKITVRIDTHGRVAGMKFTYNNCALDSIFGDYQTGNNDEEIHEACLSFGEDLLGIRCSYHRKSKNYDRKTLRGLEFSTSRRVLTFGETSNGLCSVEHHVLESNTGKWIYWVYNALYDHLLSSF
ncbi:hypothetical protein L228DRAFT_286071 [Xylona heveae TC161]|uniref:F-box domain-containing protein n=1 Tax=Xylona heveae (strain CBS 132557 / TC161) TaxID=1328760 RepID=A0A164ZKQ5_XYLHT|nr:hypothetical protein L228DRAFT_286071 [Xylona heveae TC161]KZF19215.1 hypothetical protein L228DRAFT_286071 [Xylona heveae TC161]